MTLAFPTLRLTPCRGRDTVIPLFFASVHRNHSDIFFICENLRNLRPYPLLELK